MRVDLLLLVLAFGLGTLVAEAAGAVNTGTAMGFGQIAFALVLVAVLARRA